MTQPFTTYVINREDAHDRWRRIESDLGEVGIYPTRVNATLAESIDDSFMRDGECSVMRKWLDPYTGLLVNTGEIACLLSHHSVWQQIAASGTTSIVLEDDALLEADFNSRLQVIGRLQEQHDLDLIYLGYKPLGPISDQRDGLCDPGYCYWTVGYMLSPTGARKLLATTILRNILPADEFLPAMFNRHPNALVQHVFKDFEKLGVRAADPPIVRPDFQVESQISTQPEYVYHFIVLTVASDPDKAALLTESLDRFSVPYRVLGCGQSWRGGDMTGTGGGQKINLLREALGDLDDDTVVLFMDGYDTLVNANSASLLRMYARYDHDIVFAAEKSCWPDGSLASQYPESPTEYRYLNSGSFIGSAGALKKLAAESIDDSEDDQLYFTRAFLSGDHDMAVDIGCNLFQTLSFSENDVILTGRIIKNIITDTLPLVLHGNGGESSKLRYQEIGTKLQIAAHYPLYTDLYTYERAANPENIWSVPSPDILQLTFWTDGFCRLLIETAESLDEWQSLPGDNVPGQELRLRRISEKLYQNVVAHFEWRVVPWLQQHWLPYSYCGIKDIFLIKYSASTQAELDLHNDRAHVSASIKLNDQYRGGVLEFPRQQFTNQNVPVGSMIVWPSSLTHPHRSTPVEQGTKYSLTFWTQEQ
ncbi:MAG: glycosyltransferase family 25 protein [Pseudomonadota bacterium]